VRGVLLHLDRVVEAGRENPTSVTLMVDTTMVAFDPIKENDDKFFRSVLKSKVKIRNI